MAWISNDKFTYVVQIDVSVLREKLRELDVVAIYCPLDRNKCHFDLSPLEEGIDALKMRFRDLVQNVIKKFPRTADKDPKVPTTDQEREEVERIKMELSGLLKIVFMPVIDSK